MRLRLYILRTLVWKDVLRLVRNGPALMLLGLMVILALLAGASGLIEEEQQEALPSASRSAAWIVYQEDGKWVDFLRRRVPDELDIQFFDAEDLGEEPYPSTVCVIELNGIAFDSGRGQMREQVRYRYPGSDPSVLWPVARWFLSISLEYFGEVPQLFETIQPLAPPTRSEETRAALESVSIADILSLPLIGTALLTTIQFFAACGLLVSLTAQERERGMLRALLLSPATYFELILAKAVVHGGLAFGVSALAMALLLPEALGSLLFWSTLLASTTGYFAVGLLICSFAKNQAAPNLLSFAYLLLIGSLNLLGYRFEAFQFLSALTFERYGLVYTLASLSNPDLSADVSLAVLRSPNFRILVLLSTGMLVLAYLVGFRRMRRE